MDGEDEDPFAFIAKLCQILPSQELILRSCPFAREFEFFSGDIDGDGFGDDSSTVRYGTPVESTGIVMVSLPETPRDESTSRDDQFQSPREGPNLLSGTEEQHIEIPDHRADGGGETEPVDGCCADVEKMVDLGKDSDVVFSEVQNVPVSSEEEQRRITIADHGFSDETVDVGCTDGEKTVDLGKDSDQGFSGVQSILISSKEQLITIVDNGSDETALIDGDDETVNMAIDGGDETIVVDGGCTDTEGTVDLGKDSDLGFSRVKLTQMIYHVVSKLSDEVLGEKPAKRLKLCGNNVDLPKCSRAGAEELEESQERIIRTVEGSQSEGVSPGEFKSTENLDGDEVKWDEDFGLVSYNGPTEPIKSESERNYGVLGYGEATETKDSATMMIDVCVDNKLQGNVKNTGDTENGSTGTDSHKRRREWPIRENVAEGEHVLSHILSSDCVLNVMRVLAERCAPKYGNADMLEIAMRQCMTFPRPSWWSPDYRPSWWPEGYGED